MFNNLHTLHLRFAKKIFKKREIVIFLSFAIVGTIIFIIHAASPYVTLEAEHGSLGSSAIICNDVNASGGQCIRFGTNTIPQIGTSNYMTGVTLTQDQKDGQYTPLLNSSTDIVNQHIYNFGALNPIGSLTNLDYINETYNLTMNFNSLDQRYGTATTSGLLKDYSTNTVLTACCTEKELMSTADQIANANPNSTAPEWVYLSSNTAQDPNVVQEYADPSRQLKYRIYADMVAQTVARYPKIKYVQVWNEMKGFYDTGFNGLGDGNAAHNGSENYKKYTVLYNLVYDAVKQVAQKQSRTIEVGGPYVVTSSYSTLDNDWWSSTVCGSWGCIDQRALETIKYWYTNKHGADFITLDIKNHNHCDDPNVTTNKSICSIEQEPDPYKRMDKYKVVVDWVRGLDPILYPGAKTLPLFWAEWYARNKPGISSATATDPRLFNPTNLAYQGTVPMRNSLMSAGLIKVVKSGVSTALIWGAEGLDYAGPPIENGVYHPLGLYDPSLTATPVYNTQKCIKDHFGPGTTLFDAGNSTDTSVETLASANWALVVNKTNSAQSTQIFSKNTVNLNSYEVQCLPVSQ